MPSISKRLYLRGLSKDVAEEDLSTLLSCYGVITEVKLLPHYAFVQFQSEKDAATVLEAYRNQPLMGKKVVIEFAHPLRKDMPSFSSNDTYEASENSRSPQYGSISRHPVVVMDIPEDVRWQELKDFGRLSGRMVAFCDLDKTRKGKGFIEYFTREDAKRAVRVLDGKRLGGRYVRVMHYERADRRLWRPSNRSRSPRPGGVYRPSRYAFGYDENANSEYERPKYKPHQSYDLDPYDPRDRFPLTAFSNGISQSYLLGGLENGSELSSSQWITDWASAADQGSHQHDHGYGYTLAYDYGREHLLEGGCCTEHDPGYGRGFNSVHQSRQIETGHLDTYQKAPRL